MKIDPEWQLGGRDIIKDHLGIQDGTETYFSFCAIARCDPDNGDPHCPDCVKHGQRGGTPLSTEKWVDSDSGAPTNFSGTVLDGSHTQEWSQGAGPRYPAHFKPDPSR